MPPDTWNPEYSRAPPPPSGAAPGWTSPACGFDAAGGAWAGAAGGAWVGTPGSSYCQGYGGAGGAGGGVTGVGAGYDVGTGGGTAFGGGGIGNLADGLGANGACVGEHGSYMYEQRTSYTCGGDHPGAAAFSGGGYHPHGLSVSPHGLPVSTDRRAYHPSVSALPPVPNSFPAVVLEPSLGMPAAAVAEATCLLATAVGKPSAIQMALLTPPPRGRPGAPRYEFQRGPDMPRSVYERLCPFIPVFPWLAGGGGGVPVPPAGSLFPRLGMPERILGADFPATPAAPTVADEVRHAADTVFRHWAMGYTTLPVERFIMATWTAGVNLCDAVERTVWPNGVSLHDFTEWWVQQWVRWRFAHRLHHHQ